MLLIYQTMAVQIFAEIILRTIQNLRNSQNLGPVKYMNLLANVKHWEVEQQVLRSGQ